MKSMFPNVRARRLRKSAPLRAMVRETALSHDDFIYPLFICPGEKVKRPVKSMPNVYNMSVDKALEEALELEKLGLRAVILFGIPEKKDAAGSEAYAENSPLHRAVRALKENTKLVVITDVCLCEYTDHGHCGVIKDGDVENDPTLELLAKTALSHARAGADMVAPSDMMDGRVAKIRESLDREGLQNTIIMSYAVKYASAFYGPFREAAGSAPSFGDRKSYQMDAANRREALREALLDVEEGADIIMVKPALPYLDIIREVRDKVNLPLAAYNVSGEYSMIYAAVERGWLEEERAILETLTSIKRAGAELIITYFAKKALTLL